MWLGYVDLPTLTALRRGSSSVVRAGDEWARDAVLAPVGNGERKEQSHEAVAESPGTVAVQKTPASLGTDAMKKNSVLSASSALSASSTLSASSASSLLALATKKADGGSCTAPAVLAVA